MISHSLLRERREKVLWETWTETWDSEARKQQYCAGIDSADLCPKTEPLEQRDLILYVLASRLQTQ
jgi:hypothetical protein